MLLMRCCQCPIHVSFSILQCSLDIIFDNATTAYLLATKILLMRDTYLSGDLD
jgi:hypothetical protein